MSAVETPDSTTHGWFLRLERRDRARARLVVFPHAGGGPGALADLAAHLPDDIEPWALNLPGRQARLHEAPRTDVERLIADIAGDLADIPGYRAYFGYCGGALLAYLAARAATPDRLFVGSFAAPDVAPLPRRLHQLPEDMFWDAVLDQGGVPPELANPDLRPVFEAALRADFALYAAYYHRRTAPLETPVTVLYGRDDDQLTRGGLLGWRRHSTSRPELCELEAGHWLVAEDPAGVAARLAARIHDDVHPAAGVPA
ncbi:thioesterase II family protein [Micromonospora sp. RTGN7]|uniref:thioesterase II family protein n=1 Tax=Micromonospora sp. RTGN7 TaxID=3016526 RepID=UPI0029FEE0A7|nr:thioesterase domain-containing protein [Micromonospora sp. RTGN7]